MDVLSWLIEKEVRNKRMDTYQVNGATSITHQSQLQVPKTQFKALFENFTPFSGLEFFL